jgi:hypothetical protein
MQKDRLNIYVNPTLSATIRELAGNEEQRISKVAEELLEIGLSVKRGEMIEQQSLPVIREIVQSELRKATAQLRMDVREDMSLEFTNEIKALTRASDNRLAALLVRIGRDVGTAYRLAFTLLAETKNPSFAKATLDYARAQAGAELSRKGNGEV